jgi:hypothetical protein
VEAEGQESSAVQTTQTRNFKTNNKTQTLVKKCTKAEVVARLVGVMKDWQLVCGEDYLTFSKRYVAFMLGAQRKGAPESEWVDISRRAVKDYFNGNSGE